MNEAFRSKRSVGTGTTAQAQEDKPQVDLSQLSDAELVGQVDAALGVFSNLGELLLELRDRMDPSKGSGASQSPGSQGGGGS